MESATTLPENTIILEEPEELEENKVETTPETINNDENTEEESNLVIVEEEEIPMAAKLAEESRKKFSKLDIYQRRRLLQEQLYDLIYWQSLLNSEFEETNQKLVYDKKIKMSNKA